MADERRYTEGGKRAHLVPRFTGGLAARAVCGFEVFNAAFDWLGTGSQAECEQAEALPLCKPCGKKARQ